MQSLAPDHPKVRTFRWVVFLVAVIYALRKFGIEANYDPFGGPFRFLTFWALLLSVISAGCMLLVSTGKTSRNWDVLVAATAVSNALVVMLYWRLYFTDPALVSANGPGVWYDEYYLHLAGPLVQWIDALIIFGVFRRVIPALFALAGMLVAYVSWIEFFVAPRNVFPTGSVTSGLPYPFLNSMEFSERLGFYGTTMGSLVMFLAVFWILSIASRKLLPR